MASSLVRCCTQLALAMMVLVQLLEVAQGAKRNSRRDDESDDTPMEMAWAGLKLTFAFSPFIGLFFFMFCSAFESKEKESLKRAKKRLSKGTLRSIGTRLTFVFRRIDNLHLRQNLCSQPYLTLNRFAAGSMA